MPKSMRSRLKIKGRKVIRPFQAIPIQVQKSTVKGQIPGIHIKFRGQTSNFQSILNKQMSFSLLFEHFHVFLEDENDTEGAECLGFSIHPLY